MHEHVHRLEADADDDQDRIGADLLEQVREGGVGRGVPEAIASLLSARELEVLELLATGRANRQIADELVVALDTVKKHVSHILDKLGASNRTEAVTRARDLGLIP